MPQTYGEYFEILHIAADSHDQELLKQYLASEDNDLEPIASRLLELVLNTCESVVIEKQYIDEDYRAGYARFYYLRHNDTPRRCHRLHFFECAISPTDLVHISESVAASYRGFTVVRPLPGFKIGRSLLSPKLAQGSDSKNVSHFITCTAEFHANLAGNDLAFQAVPAMEQDTLVSACASASMWVASYVLSHRHVADYKKYSTPEITDLAANSPFIGRAMPSEGLTIEQILGGLQKMGYEPMPFTQVSAQAAIGICYRYIESEFPVIVVLDIERPSGFLGHAMTAIGHGFDIERTPTVERVPLSAGQELLLCRSSDMVSGFTVQDDAGGPFRNLEFLTWDEAESASLVTRQTREDASSMYKCVAVLDKGTAAQELGFLLGLVVPLPSGIALSGRLAEVKSQYLIATWHAQLSVPTPPRGITRTYLQRSNALKERLGDSSVPENLRTELRRHLLPKWVWVTEYGSYDEYLDSHRCFGLVIQDSASHPKRLDYTSLVAHAAPGFMALLKPDGTSTTWQLPTDVSLPILRRS